MNKFIADPLRSHVVKNYILIIVVGAFFCACRKDRSKDANVDCSGPQKSFSFEVRPVVETSCAIGSGCHANGSTNGPGALTNYIEVFSSRTEIREVVASGHMPLNGHLTTAEKTAIICWIDSGAPNN